VTAAFTYACANLRRVCSHTFHLTMRIRHASTMISVTWPTVMVIFGQPRNLSNFQILQHARQLVDQKQSR
jgi:hypothetical protein